MHAKTACTKDTACHLSMVTLIKECLPGAQCRSPTSRQPSLQQLALLCLVHVHTQQPVYKGHLTAFTEVLRGQACAFAGVHRGQACAFYRVLRGKTCAFLFLGLLRGQGYAFSSLMQLPTACGATESGFGNGWDLHEDFEGLLESNQTTFLRLLS